MMILLFILSLWSASVQAQEFSVAGFRLLPNDVSAFITPVRDLNDELAPGEGRSTLRLCLLHPARNRIAKR